VQTCELSALSVSPDLHKDFRGPETGCQGTHQNQRLGWNGRPARARPPEAQCGDRVGDFRFGSN
jgi:hypothetical protein